MTTIGIIACIVWVANAAAAYTFSRRAAKHREAAYAYYAEADELHDETLQVQEHTRMVVNARPVHCHEGALLVTRESGAFFVTGYRIRRRGDGTAVATINAIDPVSWEAFKVTRSETNAE